MIISNYLRFHSSQIVKYSRSSSNKQLSVRSSILKPIELVPERIHRHLFGETSVNSSNLNDIYEDLELPERSEINLVKHFEQIATNQIAEYKRQLDEAAVFRTVPDMPKLWSFQSGWIKYLPDSGEPIKVFHF